jgi:hypothetical protein
MADTTAVRLPVWRLLTDWEPSGARVTGRLFFESVTRQCIVGWSFGEPNRVPALEVIVDLRRLDSPQRYLFRAVRVPRSDVAAHFQNSALLMCGFRACIDVPPGDYEMHVIQQDRYSYCDTVTKNVSVP